MDTLDRHDPRTTRMRQRNKLGRIGNFRAVNGRSHGLSASGFLYALFVVAITLTSSVSNVVMAEAGPSDVSDSISADVIARNEVLPTVDEVIPGVLNAQYPELLIAAEIGCEKGRTDSLICRLSDDQVKAIPSDLKALTDELTQAAASVKESVGEIRETAVPLGGLAAAVQRGTGVVAAVAKASHHPAVRNASNRAGLFADWAARTTTSGEALTTSNVEMYAKAAAYVLASFVPPLGDLAALVESISDGNLEQGIVAVMGLAAVSIGAVFPPAGAIMAVGLAVYGLSKFLWNYFLAKPRDWIEDPPGDAHEMFERGAYIKWVEYKWRNETVNIIVRKNEPVTMQVLLIDSKWATYKGKEKPVTYTLPAGAEKFYGSTRPMTDFIEPVVIVWQDGKARTSECRLVDGKVECSGLTKSVTIASGNPAVLEVRWLRKDYSKAPRCTFVVPHGKGYQCVGMNRLTVLSEGRKQVEIPLAFSVGYQGAY